MKFLKKQAITVFTATALMLGAYTASAADYEFDTKGAHAFVQFRVQHLGYSWLYGRFNKFDGRFTYDEAAPENSSVEVTIDTSSVDSNHAERDKHLRSDDFLNVEKFPEATFVSSEFILGEGNNATLKGELTLNGVTKPIEIAVEKIGGGADPWGGERLGFEGRTSFKMADFGIKKNLGPASTDVEMMLSVEGIKQ